MRRLSPLFAALLVGCPTADGPLLQEPDTGSIVAGEEVRCAAPTAGFERLTERAEERGIDLVYEGGLSPGSCALIPGGVAAVDLDDDGDVDLLFQRPEGFPHTFWNDGTGRFEAGPPGEAITPYGRHALGFAAVDLDGDRLPEIAVVGASFAALARNLGGGEFAPFEVLWKEDAFPRLCINSMGWGDADGDGDLDLALPTLDAVPYEGAPAIEMETPVGHPDTLLLLEDGAVHDVLSLQPAAGPGLAVMAAFTDREGDGDTELMIASDRGLFQNLGPSALYMREAVDAEGRPALTDRAPELELDMRLSGMGGDARDINDDGALDYCFSDVEFHLSCATSMAGGYVRSGGSMGLVPTSEDHPLWPGDTPDWIWSTWGMAWVDLDNDGLPDMAAAGGPPPPDVCGADALCGWQPDALFRGVDRGAFENRSLEAGFADPSANFGLVSADLSGDGYHELIVGPLAGRPRLFDNPCGAEAWLEIALRGPPENSAAVGGRVTVSSSSGRETQQIWSLRALGQGPSALHFGLGAAESADVEVLWPDGTVTAATVPSRRVVTASHPGAP